MVPEAPAPAGAQKRLPSCLCAPSAVTGELTALKVCFSGCEPFHGSVRSSEPSFSHSLSQDVSWEPAFHLRANLSRRQTPTISPSGRSLQAPCLTSQPAQIPGSESLSVWQQRYPGEPARSGDSGPRRAGRGPPPCRSRVLFCTHRRPSGVAHHPHPVPASPRWPSGPRSPPGTLVLTPLQACFLTPAHACHMPWALSPDSSSETQPVLLAASHPSTWLLGPLTHP